MFLVVLIFLGKFRIETVFVIATVLQSSENDSSMNLIKLGSINYISRKRNDMFTSVLREWLIEAPSKNTLHGENLIKTFFG